MKALISVALCFPQLPHKCTHLALIKNLWVSLCCVTAVRHLILWHGEQLRAGQSRKITRVGKNEKVRRDCTKMWKGAVKWEEQREKKWHKRQRRGERERSQCRGEEQGHRQHQHWGLHSNDVTSYWHCWTEKQISHLIFALILVPVSSSQLTQPAYWGYMTCGYSSALLSSSVTYLIPLHTSLLSSCPPFFCNQGQWYPPPLFM